MNPNSSDAAGPEYSEGESDLQEVALLVGRYLDPTESVPDDDLREALDQLVRDRVLDVKLGDAGITVIIERTTASGDAVRETYSLRQVTGMDGNPALEWSYLGPHTGE